MRRSVDTLKLHLTDFEIDRDAHLLIQYGLFDLATQEQEQKQLYKRGDFEILGAKAFLNTQTYNFTLTQYGAFAQFSAPKLFYGHNDESLNADGLAQVTHTLETDLRQNGVRTDLLKADISRLDIFKQEQTRYITSDYRDVFTLLSGRRQQKRDYGESFLFYNSQRETMFYDKQIEQGIRDGLKDLSASHTLRGESRLLTKKAVNRSGLVTLSDLQKDYDVINDIHSRNMKDIFTVKSFESGADLYLTSSDVERELLYIKQLYGTLGLSQVRRYISQYGLKYILENYSAERFINVACSLSDNKNLRDLKAKLDKYFRTETLGAKSLPSKQRQLYDELRQKFAV